MRISIVISYFNRRDQFLRTLKSIKYFGDPEIIVVDDGSEEEHRLEDIAGITLIRINKEEKTWVNTCIPYNMGLAQATGDIIIIQNAECIHTGDILTYCRKLTKGTVFSFAAYSLDRDLPFPAEGMEVRDLRPMILKEPPRTQNGHHGWYNHTIHKPTKLHFCNAYMRDDLYSIGGFDERYAPGLAYEDNELLARTERAGIKVEIIDDPFVIHQKHVRTDYGRGTRDVYLANKRLYEGMTLKGRFIKPPKNAYFMSFNDTASATHTPLIEYALDKLRPSFIMELGVGWFSTALFDRYVRTTGAQYIGIENDKIWITDIKEKYPSLSIVHHDIYPITRGERAIGLSRYWLDTITDYYRGLSVPDVSPKLLFVDNYASCRTIAFNVLKDKFDIIIVHDCELAVMQWYDYDKMDTKRLHVQYLKCNLSWAMIMTRIPLSEDISPFIEKFMTEHDDITEMYLTPSYL